MKVKIFSIPSILSLLLLTYSFTLLSCQVESNDIEFQKTPSISSLVNVNEIASLQGVYQDDFNAYYKISKDLFSTYGESFTGYSGNNIKVFRINKSSGYIYMRYTVALMQDGTYSDKSPLCNNYYAVSYKDLKKDSVKLSGAYKKGGKDATPTLEEAIKEFRIENGYYTYYSECVRVK